MDIAAWLRSLGLEMRMARLDTGMAWAEDAPSRTPAQNARARAATDALDVRQWKSANLP